MRTSLVFVFFIGLCIQACGPTAEEKAKMIEEGKMLVEASDCKTCHQINARIIGPAHLDVAKKYETTEANVKLLAEHIIKGGSGVWGEQPMNAHTDLSTEDAQKMARYVLSLDEQQQ